MNLDTGAQQGSGCESDVVFDRSVLQIDCEDVCRQIEQAIRQIVGRKLHRRGVVLGVSGGVDSAVCAALAVRALGCERVVGLLMPEHDSSPESTARGRAVCETLGIEPGGTTEDGLITVETVMCLAACDHAPVFQLQGPDGIHYYEDMTLESTLDLIEELRQRADDD